MTLKYVPLIAALAFIGQTAGASAAGDAAAGETLFKQKCGVCHKIGEGAKNMVGPELNGIVGRKSASVPGFNYSQALKDSGITWEDEKLHAWLTEPKALVPGTKMIFPGLPKAEDRDNVLAYVESFDADGKKK
ncbi:c-type cytochrome [Methylocella sp.]|uniref:c-type cytochrome n=1 Tax=Methylocella sp. TaxID=1978226 RepID=UPI0037848988